MLRIKILLIIVPLILIFNSFQGNDMKISNVLFCYGKLNPSIVKDYKYVILESKHYTTDDVRVMKSHNQKIFAYISLGEINENSTHFNDLKKYTFGKNEIWSSHYISLNSKKANEILIEMVDEIFAFGYDGLFLDNIDNYTIHGPQKDQTEKVIQLIKMIKEKYPKKMFIQNAGLDLAEETSRYIDLIAVESIATDYSFKEKKCKLRDKINFEANLSRVNTISATYSIPFIIIEYAESKPLVDQVEERLSATGFDYFIGSIDLQTIPKFNH
jgi:endo-alpha-1,4-polygalactosaminidase (GH114 family)